MEQRKAKKNTLVSGLCAASPQTRASAFFFFFAAKIAGLIGILPCCVLNNFFTSRGMNVCPIYEASLSHHTLYLGNLVPMYHYFPTKKTQTCHRTDFDADYDQKLETCVFWPNDSFSWVSGHPTQPYGRY